MSINLNAFQSPAAAAPVVALAPMSGVTDVVFRRIAARYGADFTVTEMVAAGEWTAGSEEARLRAEGAGVAAHVVQLAGREPHWIAEAAHLAEASGAASVDLNMGCPAKKVVGGHGGSALLKDLDLAVRLIEAAVGAVSVPVTVKMRLGWDESRIVAPELARRAELAGARRLTVHGRTRAQFYTGRADWRAIRAVVEATALPVIANGDIVSVDDCRDALHQSGAAGLMVGRGAQGRPWLVGRLSDALKMGRLAAPPALAEQWAVACEHYEGLLGLMGQEAGIRHARKHIGWYLDAAEETAGCSLAPDVRLAILTSSSPREVLTLFGDAYERLAWKAAA